ncbi:MAG: hypothetical protein IJU57_00875 [Clostridia bacterium]|nr:hypothetical protein [Clostridia bacterium]
MEIMDRNYKYYPKVNGIWTCADGAWKLEISDGKLAVIREPDIRLDTYFSCANEEECSLGMTLILNPFREDEEFRITLSTPSLHNIMTGEAYKFGNIWYGKGAIHMELTDGSGSAPKQLDFTRKAEDNPGWTCSCGHKGNKARFCTECGRPRESWDCACGKKDNNGNFCTHCGRRRNPLK